MAGGFHSSHSINQPPSNTAVAPPAHSPLFTGFFSRQSVFWLGRGYLFGLLIVFVFFPAIFAALPVLGWMQFAVDALVGIYSFYLLWSDPSFWADPKKEGRTHKSITTATTTTVLVLLALAIFGVYFMGPMAGPVFFSALVAVKAGEAVYNATRSAFSKNKDAKWGKFNFWRAALGVACASLYAGFLISFFFMPQFSLPLFVFALSGKFLLGGAATGIFIVWQMIDTALEGYQAHANSVAKKAVEVTRESDLEYRNNVESSVLKDAPQANLNNPPQQQQLAKESSSTSSIKQKSKVSYDPDSTQQGSATRNDESQNTPLLQPDHPEGSRVIIPSVTSKEQQPAAEQELEKATPKPASPESRKETISTATTSSEQLPTEQESGKAKTKPADFVPPNFGSNRNLLYRPIDLNPHVASNPILVGSPPSFN